MAYNKNLCASKFGIEREAKPMADQTLPNLPIVHLTEENMQIGASSWLKTCKEVRSALEEYGCFIIIPKYDKFSSKFDKEVFDALKELFGLPTETKVQNTANMRAYGYVGQMPHLSIHESLGIEYATTLEAVEKFTHLMWPAGNPKFCETMLSYLKLVSELEEVVNRMVFESYGVQKYYDSHVKSSISHLKTFKYRAPQMHERNVGSDPHTDKTFSTILHQNEVNGLQVQARNGQWIDVDFPPESFLFLAGDAYLAWSNGRVHSPLHQVIMHGSKTRYAIASFSFHTGISVTPEEMVDDEHPLQFKPFSNFGLFDYYFEHGCLPQCTAKAYCGIGASELP